MTELKSCPKCGWLLKAEEVMERHKESMEMLAKDDGSEHNLCPFCRGFPKLESDPHRKEFGRDRFRIVCSSCYAGTRWYDSPDEAWLMWNGRVKE